MRDRTLGETKSVTFLNSFVTTVISGKERGIHARGHCEGNYLLLRRERMCSYQALDRRYY